MAEGTWNSEYFERVATSSQLAPLFDTLPGIFFFAKDREGRFTAMNGPLLDVMGASPDEVIGSTDYEFFDRDLANAYRKEDLQVMESGQAVVNQPWWVPNVNTGDIHWYCASKIPLRDKKDSVIGVAGLMRAIEDSSELTRDHRQMTRVAQYIESHYEEGLTLADLAEVAGLSTRHLQRVFKRVFRSGPIEHLMRVRIRMAAIRLVETSDSLASIAFDCGFCDQSHFSNQFRRFRGMPPAEYRNRYAASMA